MSKLVKTIFAFALGFLVAAFVAPLIVEMLTRLSPTYYITCDER